VSDLVKTTARTPLALLVAVLVAALALVGASCSSITPQALSVNGYTLSERDFLDEMASLSSLQGEEADVSSYATTQTAGWLNQRMEWVLAAEENERRGLEVTDADRARARAILTQQLSPTGQAAGGGAAEDPAGAEVLAGLPESFQTTLIDGVANQIVLGNDVIEKAGTDEGLRALYEAQKAELGEQACASHILIRAGSGQGGTEADFAAALARIQQVQAQLQGTANFAAVATASSQDTASAPSGGELGCNPQGSFVPEFDEVVWSVPVGTVSQPVRTSFGYHLILVTKRGELTFEDLREQLLASVEQNAAQLVTDSLRVAAREADVGVDPKFGRFEAEAGRIVPPEGAQAAPGTADLAGLSSLLGGGVPQG
jgi:hypothetical protein